MLAVLEVVHTGLAPKVSAGDTPLAEVLGPGVVEVACVVLKEGKVQDTWTSRAWPGREYLQGARVREWLKGAGIELLDLLDTETAPHGVQARVRLCQWLMAQAGEKALTEPTQWAAEASGPRRRVALATWSETSRQLLRQLPWGLDYFLTANYWVEPHWGSIQTFGKTHWDTPDLSFGSALTRAEVAIPESRRALPLARAAAGIAVALGMD